MAAGMVIVGAGECGARACLALRDRGYDGLVTLIGREGRAPYERPPLSKAAIIANEEPTPKFVADIAALAQRQIEFLPATEVLAIERDRRVLRVSGGRQIAYDKLLLATGARPRLLPIPGALDARVHYLRDFDQALALRHAFTPDTRIAIVGGGFIGLEIAASASQRGCRVHVIEALPRLLSRGVPAEIAAIIEARHRSAGVAIRLGLGISAIEPGTDGLRILLADGSSVACDVVVVGVGAEPNVDLARAADLRIDNGIAVDARLRTSDPNIFAAGDCCSFPLEIYDGRRVRLESWRNALDQGQFAAGSLLGGQESFAAVPWFWSDQFDLTLQVAGLPDQSLRAVRRDLPDGAFVIFHLAENGRLMSASGIGKTGAVAKDIRLAEMMIARRARPDPASLADPAVRLKSLLA